MKLAFRKPTRANLDHQIAGLDEWIGMVKDYHPGRSEAERGKRSGKINSLLDERLRLMKQRDDAAVRA